MDKAVKKESNLVLQKIRECFINPNPNPTQSPNSTSPSPSLLLSTHLGNSSHVCFQISHVSGEYGFHLHAIGLVFSRLAGHVSHHFVPTTHHTCSINTTQKEANQPDEKRQTGKTREMVNKKNLGLTERNRLSEVTIYYYK